MQAATIIPTSHRLDLPSPTPLVVLTLGAALADRLDPGAFSPDHVSLDDHGGVVVDRAMPGVRWWAPERRGAGAADVDPDSAAAAIWTLGRFLLELALGRRLDNDAVDAFDPAAHWADVDGRPLPARLVDVLGAFLVVDPAQRLQSLRAASRVCTEAAARFGDVDTALRLAARRRLLRVTADLPARDILSPGELQQLKQQTSVAGLDVVGNSALALATSSFPAVTDDAFFARSTFADDLATDLDAARDRAAAMPAASNDDRVEDNDDVDDLKLVSEHRRTLMAVGAVAAVIVIVASAWSLT